MMKPTPCDACAAKGWLRRTNAQTGDWPDVCKRCGGAGTISPTRAAFLLGVDPDIMTRVFRCKPIRAKTAARIIDAVARLA